MFSFVHTADLHLDAPLKSLALRDPALREQVAEASRRVLARIVDLCLEERVDALLIAGDLYDGAQRSMKTVGFVSVQMRRLMEGGVRVFLIRGNHDPLDSGARAFDLPPNVHLFGSDGAAVDLGPVALHGVSFTRPHMPQSLLPRFAPPLPGRCNIGLLHTSLAGAEGHDVYAPCSVADLMAHGFDYWALGHIHKRMVWGAGPLVVMPGMPQGRDMGEAGPKSVTMVRVTGTSLMLEERPVALAAFARVPLPLDGITDWVEVEGRIAAALQGAGPAGGTDLAVLRFDLTGTTPLARRLHGDSDQLLATARAEAEAQGGVAVEALRVHCTPPSASEPAQPGLPLVELAALIRDEVRTAPEFRDSARRMLADLRAALPAALRAEFGGSEAGVEAALLDALLDEGAAAVLGSLESDGPTP